MPKIPTREYVFFTSVGSLSPYCLSSVSVARIEGGVVTECEVWARRQICWRVHHLLCEYRIACSPRQWAARQQRCHWLPVM